MLLACLALLGLFTVVTADEKKPAKADKEDAPKNGKLAIGDDAPALKATKWLQGDEVTKFEKGKVYIVEFWATWCGPCIVMMPHMAELQQEYKKNVTFIGFSSKDASNTEEKVTEFVKKRGPKLKYTFAFEDNRDTNDAYMKASGQGGIPCCFVVDKESKIAWIGHPMYLDVILPKVVSGKWKGKESADEIKDIEKEVNEVFGALRGKDAEATLEKITAFEKKHPELSKIPYFLGPKLSLMVKAKKTDDVKKLAEKVIESAAKYDDATALFAVSSALRSDESKENKELMALSLKAAEQMLKTSGDKDWQALLNMAETQFAMGEKAKAKEYAEKAIDAADATNIKQFLKNRLKPVLADDTKKDKEEK